MRRADPPAQGASAEELEKRGDELRAAKNYLDAIDYYNAATKNTPGNSSIFNRIGICQLQMRRYKEAKKSFDRAIKADRTHADAYNNLGVVYYEENNYGKAIKLYEKAVTVEVIQKYVADYYHLRPADLKALTAAGVRVDVLLAAPGS